jgi:hypothetical protein
LQFLLLNYIKNDHFLILLVIRKHLKSIREDIKHEIISLPENGDFHEIKKLIDGYDYQLILPKDKRVTYNINF